MMLTSILALVISMLAVLIALIANGRLRAENRNLIGMVAEAWNRVHACEAELRARQTLDGL